MILTDAMEFAPDLVAAMDLYRAGKNQRSLRLFIEDLTKGLRTCQTVAAPSSASSARLRSSPQR